VESKLIRECQTARQVEKRRIKEMCGPHFALSVWTYVCDGVVEIGW